jgi:hypothetical protein
VKLTVTIDSDNEAVLQPREIIRILHVLEDRIRISGKKWDGGKLLDVNGNSVGEFEYNPK